MKKIDLLGERILEAREECIKYNKALAAGQNTAKSNSAFRTSNKRTNGRNISSYPADRIKIRQELQDKIIAASLVFEDKEEANRKQKLPIRARLYYDEYIEDQREIMCY